MPEGKGEPAAELAEDVRGRSAKRITRLKERFGEARTQLDRARGRRDELDSLLQRVEDAETSRRDELTAREQDVERLRTEAEARHKELERRAPDAERERAAAQSQAAQERDLRGRLEAKLADAERRADDVERELRAEFEAELVEARANADEASLRSSDEAELRADLEASNARLEAELDQARARSADDEEWQTDLEARLAQTEQQADAVLQEIDEELETTLGRAALERERRTAAEARLEQAIESERELRETVARFEREPERVPQEAPAPSEPNSQPDELTRVQRELAEVREALDAARSKDESQTPDPAQHDPDPELLEQLDRLRAELERARSEADAHVTSQEQARRRILQLEDELSKERGGAMDVGGRSRWLLHPLGQAGPEEGSAEGTQEPDRGRRSQRDLERESRTAPKDPAELAAMDDQELAQTFSAMREAAKLADDRDDRENAQAHRALARAAAEEAANRDSFGEEEREGQGVLRRRGRRRNRVLRELAAAREKALERRPIAATSGDVGEDADRSTAG